MQCYIGNIVAQWQKQLACTHSRQDVRRECSLKWLETMPPSSCSPLEPPCQCTAHTHRYLYAHALFTANCINVTITPVPIIHCTHSPLMDKLRSVTGGMQLVLLRISKSCKRTDLDGFFKKSADPDADSDSGWKYNGALSPQDVRSDQPPARGTPSTASGRPLTHDRSACGAACGTACMWSASHITGVALTVR